MYTPSGRDLQGRLQVRQSEVETRLAEAERLGPHKEEALRLRHERHLQALHRLREQLRAALGKVHDGTYGTCDACGKSIAADDLAHEPAHTLCRSCRRHEVGLD